MAQTITRDGFEFKINPATGYPMGRPPKDPAKLAVYNKIKVEAMAASMGGAVPEELSHYVDDPNETDEEVISKIGQRFEMLNKIARGACEGAVRSLIVSGAGGVGKTHTIEQIVEHYIEEENIQAELVSGVISPIHLYMLLYRNRTKNCVVVLDDADNIFWNEDALSILKAALDSSPKRKISWLSQSAALNENDVPQTFYYEGSMIFITNINFQAIVDGGKGKLAPHLQALMTRALYLDLKLHTARDVGLWIDYIITTNNILVQDGLTPNQQEEVLEFIAENRHRLRNLSIRTALKLAYFVKMSPDNWRSMAETVELK